MNEERLKRLPKSLKDRFLAGLKPARNEKTKELFGAAEAAPFHERKNRVFQQPVKPGTPEVQKARQSAMKLCRAALFPAASSGWFPAPSCARR
ncbi:MAG: hypothetical protein ACE14L_05415 [Terriglobales bacterium]